MKIVRPFPRRAAREFADQLIAECVSADEGAIDALDSASDLATCKARCPAEFTADQVAFVQRRVLKAYLRAIGRA